MYVVHVCTRLLTVDVICLIHVMAVEANCPGVQPPAPPMMPKAEMASQFAASCFAIQHYYSNNLVPSAAVTPMLEAALESACALMSPLLTAAYDSVPATTGPLAGQQTVSGLLGCSPIVPPSDATTCAALSSALLTTCHSIVAECVGGAALATFDIPVVVTSFTLAGDLSDFNETKLTQLAETIADNLDIHPGQVTVSAVAGSVALTAEISAPDEPQAAGSSATLTSGIFANSAAASAGLGEAVDNIDPPTTSTRSVAVPADPSAAPASSSTSNPDLAGYAGSSVTVEAGGKIHIRAGGMLVVG